METTTRRNRRRLQRERERYRLRVERKPGRSSHVETVGGYTGGAMSPDITPNDDAPREDRIAYISKRLRIPTDEAERLLDSMEEGSA